MSDPSRFPSGDVAIVGIGCTEFSRDSGMSVFQLATQSISAAVADAGLSISDVDGLCTYGPNDSISPNILAQAHGHPEHELLRRPVLRRKRFTHDGWAGNAGASRRSCRLRRLLPGHQRPVGNPAQRLEPGWRSAASLGHAVQVRRGRGGSGTGDRPHRAGPHAETRHHFRGLRSDRGAEPHERSRQRAGDDAQADDPG